MGGWVGEWVDVKAILTITYCNQKVVYCENSSIRDKPTSVEILTLLTEGVPSSSTREGDGGHREYLG